MKTAVSETVLLQGGPHDGTTGETLERINRIMKPDLSHLSEKERLEWLLASTPKRGVLRAANYERTNEVDEASGLPVFRYVP